MKIHGLQKMTLLDFPEHVACTVFLGGCDLRCPFCHNYELADGSAQPVMDEEELFAFLEKRTGLLDGVAVTGGEPCLHRDLTDLLRRIRAMGYKTKLDTNGFHPEMLRRILEEGLADYIAMDIKNSPERYAGTAGVPGLDLAPVRESVRMLLDLRPEKKKNVAAAEKQEACEKAACSRPAYEFRTTVVKEFHRPEDFEEIGKWIAGADAYYLQCFTDRDSVPYGDLHTQEKEDIEEYLRIVGKYVPSAKIRGSD